MYLEHISIRHFRLFESFELTLNPGLNILVGENDSGKTALIDAIRYTLGTNSSERLYLEEDDFYNNENKFSIQLKFTNVDKNAHIFVEHLTHEEYLDNNIKKHRSVLYLQLTAEKTGREKRGYPYIKTELRSGRSGDGLLIEGEIRSFLSSTYLKPLRDAESELKAGRGSRLSQILNSYKDFKDDSVDEILALVANMNAGLIKEEKPIHRVSGKIQNDYLHELIFTKDKTLLKAIITIAGVRNEAHLNTLSSVEKRKYLRAILESLSLSLTEHRRKHGLGYHNLLFMAAELLLLEQESDNENEFPLLLIEEPEAHLHPQLQMKLLQFIRAKSKKDKDDEGIQCLLTTHSPNISSKASPESIIMLCKDQNDKKEYVGKAFSLRSEETQLKPEDYKFLEKFLDATKANLFFCRGLILVEGDAENILLPTIARLLGKPLEDYGVSIVKYDNSWSWKRFAHIFLRKDADTDKSKQNPVKVVVLRDLDLWPDCAEEIKDVKNNDFEFGFKTRKNRNAKYWKSCYNDQELQTYRDDLISNLSRQQVQVEVSDEWTFEYCLAYYGLFDECYQALQTKESINFKDHSEKRATFILSKIKDTKTDFVYELAKILEEKYANDPQKLAENLPPYIVRAINYVTGLVPTDEG